MPNNDKELKKRIKANQSAITTSAKKQQEKANDAAKSAIDSEKLKYDAIPFKNVEIDRMNAQKEKLF